MKNLDQLVFQSMSDDVIGVVLQRSRPSYENCAEEKAVQVYPGSQTTRNYGKKHDSQSAKDENGARAERLERGRVNQARFRIRQKKRITSLETQVYQLQQEIEQLQRERDQIVFGSPTKKTLWVVAVEYFRIFQYGFHTAEGVCDVDMDFLRSFLAPNMTTSTSIGFAAHLRRWRVFTDCFPDVHVQLRHLGLRTKNSLLASTSTTITITAASLRMLFPHLVNAEHCSRCSELVAKLQGRCLVIPGSMRFDWDEASSQVIGLHVQMDLVSPLLRILGSLEDVSLVFSLARITPEGNLVA